MLMLILMLILCTKLSIGAYCSVLMLVHDHGEDCADVAADDARDQQQGCLTGPSGEEVLLVADADCPPHCQYWS